MDFFIAGDHSPYIDYRDDWHEDSREVARLIPWLMQSVWHDVDYRDDRLDSVGELLESYVADPHEYDDEYRLMLKEHTREVNRRASKQSA